MEEWYNRNGGFSRDSSNVASVIEKTYVCNKNSEMILIDYFKRKKEEVETVYIGVDDEYYNPQKYNKEEILKDKNINVDGKGEINVSKFSNSYNRIMSNIPSFPILSLSNTFLSISISI